MHIIGTIYPSNAFSYDSSTMTFTSEISETQEVLRQLWDDSLDIGFGIRSAKSGNVVFFTLDKMEKDAEGDTICWKFVVHNPRNDAHITRLSVTVLND